ncbi:MAG TPA: WD40 repeat domain-containing protein [Planctomicrobium sp.]|nr:WD40 repeat domain-containing protein [Planctomicrobium sp.]
MSNADESDFRNGPSWLSGRGLAPTLKWRVGTDGTLACLCLSRETGEIFSADQTGTIHRIDRKGNIAGLTRVSPSIVSLVWSDDGTQGAAIIGEDEVVRLGQSLKTVHKLSLPDVCLGLAISPYGNHLAVSLANGKTLIYNERSKKIAQFETLRPLSFLQFCSTESLLFGAAENGLVCCFNLTGAEVWQERNLANVGKLAITGEGDLVYTASFAHGVQAFDGDGSFIGAYIVDGTVNRVDASFEPDRVIVSTVERSLYWMDADGDQLWSTNVDNPIVDVLCDPLGEWVVVGLQDKGIYHLDWGDRT